MTPPAPAVFMWTAVLSAQGEVLLGQRSGSRHADGLWNLPGGAAEPGEDLRWADPARLTQQRYGAGSLNWAVLG